MCHVQKSVHFVFVKGATVNTNMFVEAFHRKLKTVYFQKKQNRRVDRLVFTLLKISRDLIFEGLRKDEIGKRSHRKCEIRKRCQTAIERKRKGAKAAPVSENTWRSESSKSDGIFYTVHLSKKSCDCHLRCQTCGACVHMYVCSCIDCAVHYTVCKHAHLVHMQREEEVEKELFDTLIELQQNNGQETGPLEEELEEPLKEAEIEETCHREENCKVAGSNLTCRDDWKTRWRLHSVGLTSMGVSSPGQNIIH